MINNNQINVGFVMNFKKEKQNGFQVLNIFNR